MEKTGSRGSTAQAVKLSAERTCAREQREEERALHGRCATSRRANQKNIEKDFERDRGFIEIRCYRFISRRCRYDGFWLLMIALTVSFESIVTSSPILWSSLYIEDVWV